MAYFLRPFLSIFFPMTFNDIYIDYGQVEVERIDIGEPENTGMYDMVTRFLKLKI